MLKYQYRTFVIEPSGHIQTHVTKNAPSLDELQDWCGGWVQMVPHFTKLASRTRGTAWVNEEGILLSLPYNNPATVLWQKQYKFATSIFGNIAVHFREKLPGIEEITS